MHFIVCLSDFAQLLGGGPTTVANECAWLAGAK
jgi:hypothetical protein